MDYFGHDSSPVYWNTENMLFIYVVFLGRVVIVYYRQSTAKKYRAIKHPHTISGVFLSFFSGYDAELTNVFL